MVARALWRSEALRAVPWLRPAPCRVSDQGTTLRASDLHNARATILNPFYHREICYIWYCIKFVIWNRFSSTSFGYFKHIIHSYSVLKELLTGTYVLGVTWHWSCYSAVLTTIGRDAWQWTQQRTIDSLLMLIVHKLRFQYVIFCLWLQTYLYSNNNNTLAMPYHIPG